MATKWWRRIFRQGVAEVALSGNLGFVPLDEVLRLLARAGQRGAVEIHGETIEGRIFFTPMGISLATTREDSDLREHLIHSQFVDDSDLKSAESGSETLNGIADSRPGFVELLREMTIDSLYQLSHLGSTFEVDEDAATPYGSPKAFELESVLADAAKRASEWREVEALLADMAGIFRMKRDLGSRDEITVSRDAWKLLSELGSGSSVSEMASRLGTTEFWTAKIASDLTSRELLTVLPSGPTSESLPAETAAVPEAVAVAEPEPVEVDAEVEEVTAIASDEVHEWDSSDEVVVDDVEAIDDVEVEAPMFDEAPQMETISEDLEEPVEVPAAPMEPVVAEDTPSDRNGSDEDEVDPNQSWWVEPDGKKSPAPVTADRSDSEEDKDERRGRLGMFAPTRDVDDELVAMVPDDSDEVEEDTEAFLEKVFSQLDESDEADSEVEATPDDQQDDATTGHGLLRRRRLGSILTDTSKTGD